MRSRNVPQSPQREWIFSNPTDDTGSGDRMTDWESYVYASDTGPQWRPISIGSKRPDPSDPKDRALWSIPARFFPIPIRVDVE